jgi:hypothetical protein
MSLLLLANLCLLIVWIEEQRHWPPSARFLAMVIVAALAASAMKGPSQEAEPGAGVSTNPPLASGLQFQAFQGLTL